MSGSLLGPDGRPLRRQSQFETPLWLIRDAAHVFAEAAADARVRDLRDSVYRSEPEARVPQLGISIKLWRSYQGE